MAYRPLAFWDTIGAQLGHLRRSEVAVYDLGLYSSGIFELLPDGTRERDVLPLTSYPDRAMTQFHTNESV
jgi:hypothetical protein